MSDTCSIVEEKHMGFDDHFGMGDADGDRSMKEHCSGFEEGQCLCRSSLRFCWELA